MESSNSNFSGIAFSDQSNLINRGRRKSTNTPISILTSDFFFDNAQISKIDQLALVQKIPFGRPRSGDITGERPALSEKISHDKPYSNDILNGKTIFPQKNLLCNHESKVNDVPYLKKPIEIIINSADEIPGRKFSQSLMKLKKIKSAEMLVKEKSSEEKSKFYKTEINDNITQIGVSSESVQIEINALKNDILIDPNGKSLLSLKIGEMILQPKQGSVIKEFAEKYIKQGKINPKACCEDLWRSMQCIKLYDYKSEKPLIDGSTILDDEDLKDADMSNQMGKLLNLLFQHVSKSDDILIPTKDFGSSLIDAGLLGLNFANLLEIKKSNGMDKEIAETMQLVLGLGKQELFTRPAMLAMPQAFEVYGGKDDLMLTEFGPTLCKKMMPLQYEREISIIMREDGGLDYTVKQPITFKDRKSNEPFGTCRLQTSFIFDKSMNCTSHTQEVKAASILENVDIDS